MLVVAVQVSASRSLVLLFLLICSWDFLLLELSLKDCWSGVKGEDEALLRKYDSGAAKSFEDYVIKYTRFDSGHNVYRTFGDVSFDFGILRLNLPPSWRANEVFELLLEAGEENA
jgi:hypothetical protein